MKGAVNLLKVYSKKYMQVFKNEYKEEYVVYNSKKQWEDGHTHIHTYKQALYLVDCILKSKIPKKTNKYFLVSLLRLAKDKHYIQQITNILEGNEAKQVYINTPKNLRK